MKHWSRLAALALSAAAIIGIPACAGQRAADTHAAGAVDGPRIAAADSEPGAWLAHGRTYSEQRFSPLASINDRNVAGLGLAWSVDLGTSRGVEATPLFVDGVLYTTSAWSVVMAIDAASGRVLWTFDPQVPRERAVLGCCDVVNRGVAVWQGRVYVGSHDGRLIALDAKTGGKVWEVVTVDPAQPYTITGAPRVVKGRVIIGNGGADLGVRGYVSAYDARNGKLAWRFYTVPGNPAQGFENEAMRKAAATWTGEWWRYGGGGTVWDSMAYDPELNLLYIGVGNGSPWNQAIRSPGGGDNLFLSSIVALNADTGEYVWHYQTTPGETWDYTATQHIVLAELDVDGARRKVLLQAPKNGFFYVLDRATGALLSARPYVTVNWATGVDPATGRPTENPDARYYRGKPFMQMPSPYGGHNWQPMSFSPATHLVYIPAQEIPFVFATDAGFTQRPGRWNTGTDALIAGLPDDRAVRAALKPMLKGHLLAWDPVAQKEVWRVPHTTPWNGGVLSTAGNLVFQGGGEARFSAYRADTGEMLWSAPTQTGVIAAPITYEVNGEQYVTVMAGYGGAFPLISGYFVDDASRPPLGRVLTFKLGGRANLPPLDWRPPAMPEPPVVEAAADVLATGHRLYQLNCMVCHGDSVISGGRIRDLRWSALLADAAAWQGVVRGGAMAAAGMASFANYVTQAEADAIRAYVAREARNEWNSR